MWKIEYTNLKTDANTISEFEFDSVGKLKRIKADKIEGQFNSDGNFHGKWRGIYWNSQGEKLERIYDFHNGVVAKCITREYESGEVVDVYDKSELANQFFMNYNSESKTSAINGAIYKIEAVYFSKDTYFDSEVDNTHNLLSILIEWLPEPFKWIDEKNSSNIYSFENIIIKSME